MLAWLAAAVLWKTYPLDDAWARLAKDAAAHDAAAFAADRDAIARLDEALLTTWAAVKRETYRGAGYAATIYDGPARVRDERARSRYFAVVTPDADLKQPTFWEVTPGYSPQGVTYWHVTVSGCRLEAGDPVEGHPKTWTRSASDGPPSYKAFKALIASTTAASAEFPRDTTVAHTPGTTCLYVGHLPVTPLASTAP